MLNNFRFLTAGESHGKCLTAIIDGVPSNLFVDINFINNELARRQSGYGRSSRMQLEKDSVEITAGLHNGKTTGAPICLVINNKDCEEKDSFTKFRPGHADFAGSVKYNLSDLRDVLERSSARKTAIEVAVGAIAKIILKEFDINCSSKILQVGTSLNDFEKEIDKAKAEGDSLGGKFEVSFNNLPIGLGSYVQWDKSLDGKIAQAVMSIGGIKVVEIGEYPLGKKGSEYHDELFVNDGKIFRKTNNAGGIEGGITNGEDLVVKAVMKPIPTMIKPLNTVDKNSLCECKAHFERSDTCAVEACSVVAEAKIACILVDELLSKFGGDSIEEVKRHYKDS